MDYSKTIQSASKYTPAQIYGESGLIYIRYSSLIEAKPNGQKQIGGSRPAFSSIVSQPVYSSVAGKYYSLLMGRDFKPGRWSILLDCDNKVDEASQSGLDLVKKLNMDQYDPPKQKTPSGVSTTYSTSTRNRKTTSPRARR